MEKLYEGTPPNASKSTSFPARRVIEEGLIERETGAVIVIDASAVAGVDEESVTLTVAEPEVAGAVYSPLTESMLPLPETSEKV
jgi:hypothetical protein